jgi:protein gp37
LKRPGTGVSVLAQLKGSCKKHPIGWADYVWNPTTGCDKVAAGCKNCYAAAIANRFKDKFNRFKFTIHYDRFHPRMPTLPSRIFVNSMSDLFHEKMPLENLRELFGVMGSNPQHTFIILTKRHERLVELAPSLPWHDNIWMGVSIESQEYAVRADYFKQVPAKVRFLSCEPLLGPLELNLDGIHWVIIGGESGPGCRPMDLAWVRSIKDQCVTASVPIFMKQLGGLKKQDNIMDFPIDLQIQEFPGTGASPLKPGDRKPMDQSVKPTEQITPFKVAPLTKADADLKRERNERLSALESRMEKIRDFHELACRAAANKKSFSKDLLEIHDRELYRTTHETFTLYLRDRWDLSKSYGYELVQFAREVEKSAIADNFSPGLVKAKRQGAAAQAKAEAEAKKAQDWW